MGRDDQRGAQPPHPAPQRQRARPPRCIRDRGLARRQAGWAGKHLLERILQRESRGGEGREGERERSKALYLAPDPAARPGAAGAPGPRRAGGQVGFCVMGLSAVIGLRPPLPPPSPVPSLPSCRCLSACRRSGPRKRPSAESGRGAPAAARLLSSCMRTAMRGRGRDATDREARPPAGTPGRPGRRRRRRGR